MDDAPIADYAPAWYVTKPVEVKAIRWRSGENDEAVRQFSVTSAAYCWREIDLEEDGEGIYGAEVFDYIHGTWIPMSTGQWVIRGTKSELYPCDDEVFRQKYRPLGNDGSSATSNEGGGSVGA